MKTFAAFLQTDACRAIMDSDFYARIVNAGSGIKTLTALKNWARERYPSDYVVEGWRTDTSDRPHGKEAMARMWSEFLTWSEAN